MLSVSKVWVNVPVFDESVGYYDTVQILLVVFRDTEKIQFVSLAVISYLKDKMLTLSELKRNDKAHKTIPFIS